MFLVTKPSAEKINSFISSQQQLAFSYPEVGATRGELPAHYTIDHNRIQLGAGPETVRPGDGCLAKMETLRPGMGDELCHRIS